MAGFLKRGIKRGLQKAGASLGLQEIASTQHQIVAELKKLRDISSRIQYQMPAAPDSLPIPPRELHALVSGNDELDMSAFFDVGKSCADSVVGWRYAPIALRFGLYVCPLLLRDRCYSVG
jgi:hypothetical protein